MKRLLLFLAFLVATILVPAAKTYAAADDFVIKDYKIEYVLSKDAEGRSTLKTTEIIQAEFPDINQNHGIERGIPDNYDGHKVHLDISSVTNGNTPLNYTTYSQNGHKILRVGDASTYVHGLQKYVITYYQRDVTRYFKDVNRDEFYWDTNGTQWRVPIEKLSVTLRLDKGISSQLTGHTACYHGAEGSEDRCVLTKEGDNTFIVNDGNLLPGQNDTIAIGFKPNTFTPYQKTWFEKFIWYIVSVFILASVAGVMLIVFVIVRYFKWSNRKQDMGPIAPEYIPPKDTSVTTAASILGPQAKTFAAQLVDFAVRHYIKIYQTSEKKWFSQADYDIEIAKDISTLLPEEQELLTDIFNKTPAIGDRLSLKDLRNDHKLYMRTMDNDKKLKDLVRGSYALRQRDEAKKKWFIRLGVISLILSFPFLSVTLFWASIASFVCAAIIYPLTDKGLALKRYLEGLKMYIKAAETERLRMLQSPEGAEKVGSLDPNDKGQLVKLYERVLPYAILFGQEQEWNKALGTLYESTGSQPSWYHGTNGAAFSAAAFGSAISSFSSTATYSGGSSSSGGSGGGGHSGGGGGGGGGGGW